MEKGGLAVLAAVGLSLSSCLLGLAVGAQGFAVAGLAVALASLLAYYVSEAILSLVLAVFSSLLAAAATHSPLIALVPVVQAIVAVVYSARPIEHRDLAYYLLAVAYAVYATTFIVLFTESYARIRGASPSELAGLKNILYIVSIPLVAGLSYRSASPTSTVRIGELLGPLLRVSARKVFRYVVYTLVFYDVLARPWLFPGLLIGFIAMKLAARSPKHGSEVSLLALIITYSVYDLAGWALLGVKP